MKIQHHSSKGFTLVELMITLVLSLMITYAIAQVLVSSNRSSVTSDGMSQSQETGRFVMSYLANQIRPAGLDSTTDRTITTAAFMDCTSFPALGGDPDNDEDNICITEGNGNGAGGETELSIVTEDMTHGDRLSIAWVPSPGNLVDCSGNSGYIPTGSPEGTAATPYTADSVILNTFWVQFDETSEMNSLMCQGYLFDGADVVGSSNAQAIANGVEAMQILYGEATDALPDSGDRNINRYVPAPVDPENPTAFQVQDWSRVYAVQISIMTRSLTEVTNSDALRQYVLADAEPYKMTDTVNRQVFTTTFAISNFR